jgi:PTH1 family peptidyl-tRNA hydrolase
VYGLDSIYLVVGLGNPGSRYENTRHNVGFDTVDLLAARHGIRVSKVKHKALVGDGEIGGRRVLLVKPQTYMNLSGESVREVVDWYKVPMGHILVAYDDIDIALGKIRVRPGGSSGSHNGMKSLIYLLQEDTFPRIRIGIGRPPEGWNLADYVLGRFTPEERKAVDESVGRAADAAETILSANLNEAMNRFNGQT